MSFDFDLTAPFQTAFTTRDQHEHRHKVRPVQIIAPSSTNPGKFRLNESALNSVLGHSACANKKVKFDEIYFVRKNILYTIFGQKIHEQNFFRK
ncbi:hypothetical protein L5515_010219 [Caenorhabditis briggsae]|uniref:Uncharacterized protein n=1 Tax=Caenorhabditis briggsae TaxID=6238 RepID=A0AAE9EQA6_CAEBR|nr:hypothetical protein L5515_010219 [Caenorhabditis briggsae]